MKHTPFMAAAAIAILTSCMNVKQIGTITMISTRNVESQVQYVSVRNYMGGTKKELKKHKAETVEQAVDNVVRSTPGGEFLKNVKIYVINSKYYAVEGDVWGLPNEQNFKGFKVGDSVQWKDVGTLYKGVIVDLKDEQRATVKDEKGQLRKVKYDEMLKIQ